MVFWTAIRTKNSCPLSVKIHSCVKKMEPHTIAAVQATHFGVKIVESTSIVFVDITMFYKDSSYFIRNCPPKSG